MLYVLNPSVPANDALLFLGGYACSSIVFKKGARLTYGLKICQSSHQLFVGVVELVACTNKILVCLSFLYMKLQEHCFWQYFAKYFHARENGKLYTKNGWV